MYLQSVATGKNKRVGLLQDTMQHPGVAPELWRPPCSKGASDTLRLIAYLSAKLPQQAQRANEPVLMGRQQIDRTTVTIRERKNLWPADERDVVKVDDIERVVVKHSLDGRPFHTRSSGLMSP